MKIPPILRRLVLSFVLLAVLLIIGVLGFYLIADHSLIESFYMAIITMSTVGFGTLKNLSEGEMLFVSLLIIASVGTFVYAITNLTTFVVEGEIRHLFKLFRVHSKVNKLSGHVILCGLGRNGHEASLELIRQKTDFVIIDKDEKVIRDFVNHFPKTLAIVGDATLDETLEKAGITRAKGLITALSTDAENVYITLTAKELCPKIRVIARATHESTISKLKAAGAAEVIVPNLMGGRKMTNLITRPELVEFEETISGEGDFHLEVFPCGNYPALEGKSLIELNVRLHTGAIIVGLKKADEAVELSPRAERVLTDKDRLFVLGRDAQLAEFRKVFLE